MLIAERNANINLHIGKTMPSTAMIICSEPRDLKQMNKNFKFVSFKRFNLIYLDETFDGQIIYTYLREYVCKLRYILLLRC